MRIISVRIGHFGKFHNVKFDFSEGINVIKGDNESGKSTLFAFIKAMLFGLEKPRGRAEGSAYLQYQPWDSPGAYQGSMDIVHEGKLYRITRVFYHKEKSCQITELSTGRIVNTPSNSITDLIPELTENAFNNSIGVEQKGIRAGKDLAELVQGRITNFSYSGADIDSAAALMELETKKKQVRRTLKSCDIDIHKEQVSSLESRITERDALISKQNFFAKKIEELEDKKNKLQNLRQENDAKLTAGLAKVQKQAYEKQPSAKVQTSKKQWSIKLGLMFLLLGTALCIAGSVKWEQALPAGIICLVVATALIVVFFIKRNSTLDENSEQENSSDSINFELKDLEEKLHACDRELRDIEEELRLAEKEYANLEGRISGMGDLDSELSDASLKLSEEQRIYERAQKELLALELALSTIKDISEELYYSQGKDFEKLLGEYTNAITDGKYSNIRIGSSLIPEVMSDIDYKPVSALSCGANDQIYMALRLACDKLFFENEAMPLMFDESFAYYDDNRLKQFLKLICDAENQVFLFSCQERESVMLEELEADYRLTVL